MQNNQLQRPPQELEATRINVSQNSTTQKEKIPAPPNPNSLKYQIKNQTLKGTSFLPSIKCSIIFSIVLGVIMTLLGIIVFVISGSIHETLVRYDNQCQVNQVTPCQVDFTLSEKVSKPIFIYLQVDSFYQNHRNYVKSVSTSQLNGEQISRSKAEDKCENAVYYEDIEDVATTSVGGTALDAEDVAHPCGLQAKSYAEDQVALQDSSQNLIEISTDDIAWSVDKDYKFKNIDDYEDEQWLDVENERFMNWMTFSTLYNWKKLWGKIDEDLDGGDYTFFIQSRLDVEAFGGKKSFLISNVSPLGGTSSLLATLLLIMGLAYILLALTIIGFVWCKKLNDDSNYKQLTFNWS